MCCHLLRNLDLIRYLDSAQLQVDGMQQVLATQP